MMKSFFKKLAFVMALAMVVSMVAPAGSALAAESGVSLQGTKTIVETYELDKAGATVDFAFEGCTTWKENKNNYAWTSSNEAVATVNKAGVVTAVAAGTATITIAVGDDYKESVVVTVKEEKAANAFEVKQVNTTKFAMTFDAKKDVKADDVAVVMVMNGVDYVIPVKAVSVKENVATVEMFSTIIDGLEYKVTYDNHTASFDGSLGDIVFATFNYYTDKAGDGKAYVSTDEEPCVTKLTYSLFDANGVDVTAAYDEDDLDIEFSVEENDAYDLLDNELTFNTPGVAAVKMSVVWTDATGEEVELAPYTGVVVGENRAALSHTVLKAGFMSRGWYAQGAAAEADFATNKNSFQWAENKFTTSWTLGDGNDLQFAAFVENNRGQKLVTGITEEDYGKGYFKFVTSNDDIIDVDDDGVVTFWNKGKASIITYFVDTTGEEDKEIFVAATPVTVSASRYPASYKLNTTTQSVASHTSNDAWNTANFILTVYDQYGSQIGLRYGADDIKVELATKTDLVDATKVNVYECADGCGNWATHYHIQLDGDELVTYLGTETSKVVYFNVSVDKDNNSKVATGTNKIKITVKDTETYAAALRAGTVENYYYGTNLSTGNVDLCVDYMQKFNNTWKAEVMKKATVTFSYLNSSSGFAMGDVPTSKLVRLEEGQKTGEAGKIYYDIKAPKYAVEGTNFEVMTSEWGNPINKIMLKFNTATDNSKNNGEGAVPAEINYSATGTYKVIAYYVKNSNIEDGAGKLTELKTFEINVTNSQANPTFAKYDDELGNKYDGVITEENYLDVIKEHLVFTYNGNEIAWTNGFEISCTGSQYDINEDGKLRVKKVTIKVPVDGEAAYYQDTEDQDGDGNREEYVTCIQKYFYEKEITVGKTIYSED